MERIKMKVKIEVALSAEDVLEKLGRKITSDFGNIKVDGENLFELTDYDEIEETEAGKDLRDDLEDCAMWAVELPYGEGYKDIQVYYDDNDNVFHRNVPVKVLVYLYL